MPPTPAPRIRPRLKSRRRALGLDALETRTLLSAAPAFFTEYPVGNSEGPQSLVSGSDGGLWFTEPGAGKIGRLDPATGTVTKFPIPSASGQPQGITSGPDGNIWFTEQTLDKIGRLNVATKTVTEFPLHSPFTQSFPYAITTGPDGNLWFTEQALNKIGVLNPATGNVVAEYAIPTAFSEPSAIVAGPDGALWFTEGVGNNIGRITTAGQITEFPIPTSDSQPQAITSGPDGALWFTENQAGKIGRVTTTGQVSEVTLPLGSVPYGITAGTDGNLWFTDNGTNKVGKINPATKQVTGSYVIPTRVSGPADVTTGPDGKIWFAETDASQIGRVDFNAHVPYTLTIPFSADFPPTFTATYLGADGFTSKDIGGGDFQTSLNGDSLPGTYCVDINLEIQLIGPREWDNVGVTTDGTTYGTAVPNAPAVSWLVANLGLAATTPELQNALQAAIWRAEYGSNFQLDGVDNANFLTPENAAIQAAYRADLAALGNHTAPVSNLLWISPGLNLDGVSQTQDLVALPPLLITSTNPADGSYVQALPNGQVVVNFNKPLAGLTNGGPALLPNNPYGIFLLQRGPDLQFSAPAGVDAGDLPLHANTLYTTNGTTSTVTITPLEPFGTDIYAISIDMSKFSDPAGNTLMDPLGNFHPGYRTFLLQPPPSTTGPLRVVSVTSYNGFLTIDNNATYQPDTIAIKFNKPLFAGAANGGNVQLLAHVGSNSTPVPSVATYSPTTTTIYLTPTALLQPGTQYVVSVSGAVSDDQGFSGPGFPLGQPFSDTFTVLDAPAGAGSSPLRVARDTAGKPRLVPGDGMLWGLPVGYASIQFTEALNALDLSQSVLGRYSVMLDPRNTGSDGNTGLTDVPLNAKLAFNPNTNQLIVVPTQTVGNALYVYSLGNIKAANGTDFLLNDAGTTAGLAGPPFFATFQLQVGPAAAVSVPAGPAQGAPTVRPAAATVLRPRRGFRRPAQTRATRVADRAVALLFEA